MRTSVSIVGDIDRCRAAACAVPSPGVPCTSFTVTGSHAGDQVGPHGFHHPRGHRGPRGASGRSASTVVDPSTSGGGLGGGAAFVAAVSGCFLDEDLDRLSHPVSGPLGHDLFGEIGQLAFTRRATSSSSSLMSSANVAASVPSSSE